MNNEFNKLLKCLTSKYRSLCDEDYSSITLDKDSESLCCKKKCDAIDRPTNNSSQNKKLGNKFSDSSFHAFKSVFGLKLRHPTKHLDRQQEVKDLCQVVSQPENRYTNFPFGTKKYRSKSFDETHVYITNNNRGFSNPNKVFVNPQSTPRNNQGILSSKSSLVKSLKRRKLLREKSKSDNALQQLDVRCISGSETALHALCTGNSCCRGASSNLNEYRDRLAQQLPGFATPDISRRQHTLNRQDDLHIYHSTFPANLIKERRTRSLERNYKFKVVPSSTKCPSQCTSSAISSKPVLTTNSGSSLSTHTTLIYKNKDRTVTLAIQEGRPQLCIDGEAVVTEMPRSREGDSNTRSTGNFINKPARGWLHPDQIIAGDGICYGVRYIGNLDVNTSMKSLDFDTRSLIAKECLHRICEAAGMKTVDKKRKVDKRIAKMLGENPNMKHAGTNVTLRITGSKLTLTQIETGEPVAAHEMSNISFASGGDPDTLDFVAYVAKDCQHARACFVLECGGGLAQDVITTIGQAFELRFKEYLKSAPRSKHVVDSMIASTSNNSTAASTPVEDPEYYNDMPGKVPPDVPGGDSSHCKSKFPSSFQSNTDVNLDNRKKDKSSKISNKESVDNLIDLNSETFVMPTISTTHEYVNNIVAKSMARQTAADPFDMQPFSAAVHNLTDNIHEHDTVSVKYLPADQRLLLHQEDWFHGPISRKEAESLLNKDGDFLVRESQGSPGQYVLTGMHAGCKRHLLLVDPQGIVRTKERTFDSVSHLISYHRDNCLPIISAESALVLRTPILACKTHPSR